MTFNALAPSMSEFERFGFEGDTMYRLSIKSSMHRVLVGLGLHAALCMDYIKVGN